MKSIVPMSPANLFMILPFGLRSKYDKLALKICSTMPSWIDLFEQYVTAANEKYFRKVVTVQQARRIPESLKRSDFSPSLSVKWQLPKTLQKNVYNTSLAANMLSISNTRCHFLPSPKYLLKVKRVTRTCSSFSEETTYSQFFSVYFSLTTCYSLFAGSSLAMIVSKIRSKSTYLFAPSPASSSLLRSFPSTFSTLTFLLSACIKSSFFSSSNFPID